MKITLPQTESSSLTTELLCEVKIHQSDRKVKIFKQIAATFLHREDGLPVFPLRANRIRISIGDKINGGEDRKDERGKNALYFPSNDRLTDYICSPLIIGVVLWLCFTE